jgi:hypothetical protein
MTKWQADLNKGLDSPRARVREETMKSNDKFGLHQK